MSQFRFVRYFSSLFSSSGSVMSCRWKWKFLCVLVFYFSLQSGLYSVVGRDEKLLPFFALVRIPHQTCRADTGNTSGVCTSVKSCQNIGGEQAGICASGYGACCIVKKYCTSGKPSSITVNGTHLLNRQNLPNPSVCEYRFPKKSSDGRSFGWGKSKGCSSHSDEICQVRLDFIKFVIAEPAKFTSVCERDTLSFSGASNTRNFGPLCGDISGQHVYLDYGSSSEISMNIYTLDNIGQEWDVKVTYIKCDSPERAPEGCLQYFTEQSGMVRSFNYNYMQQLNNEDYSICVRQMNGMSSLTWRSCGGFSDFFISGIPAFQPPDGLPPAGLNPLFGDDCIEDWVMIYGVNKYCGNTLQAPVTTMTQPFMLQVHFDQQELPDDDSNVGFCLAYSQSP